LNLEDVLNNFHVRLWQDRSLPTRPQRAA
jgi:hypothetical protein